MLLVCKQIKLKGTHISFDFKKIKYARKRFLLLQNLQVWSGKTLPKLAMDRGFDWNTIVETIFT